MAERLNRQQLLEIFERMLLMRRFEETVVRLSLEGHSFGHFHLYIGQEATGAAVIQGLGSEDHLFTTHRNHGHIVGRGSDPGRALAEILGKKTGLCGGRGGTLHLCDASTGFLTTSAVVGGIAALAAGAAYAAKGSGRAAIAFFGDGALEEGIVSEAFNLASLWALPVVFVCENNSPEALGQAAGEYPTSINAARKLTDIPASVAIPTASVDGRDVQAVYGAFQDAVARARKGEGPTFLEATTVRWAGSRPLWPELRTGVTDLEMAWDPSKIAGEYARWYESDDPVLRLARELLAEGHLDREALAALDEGIARRLDEAARFAVESPFPLPETATENVFA